MSKNIITMVAMQTSCIILMFVKCDWICKEESYSLPKFLSITPSCVFNISSSNYIKLLSKLGVQSNFLTGTMQKLWIIKCIHNIIICKLNMHMNNYIIISYHSFR